MQKRADDGEYYLPFPPSGEGVYSMSDATIALIIAVAVLISYATQWVPITVTAVMSALLMAFTGIIGFEDAIASFGSDALLLVVGAVIMGNALVECGVTQIVGDSILRVRVIAENERLFIAVILILCAALSGFLSNSACVAIFLPIAAAVAQESGGRIKKKNVYMGIGIASVAGGMLTMVGSTPQIIANGILMQTDGCEPLGFFGLTAGALVVVIIVVLYFCTAGYNLQKKVFNFEEKITEEAGRKTDKVPLRKTLMAGAIFCGCIVCFVLEIGSVGTIALLGACLHIATGCISEKKAFKTMDWTAYFVMGGALGFSQGMNESGAIQMVAEKTVDLFGGNDANPLVLCYVLFALAVVLTNLMSNAACAGILTPLGIAVALAIGADPRTLTIIIILGADISYVTPIASPPVTMTLSGGYRFMDYVKVGGPLALFIILVVPAVTCLIYGL